MADKKKNRGNLFVGLVLAGVAVGMVGAAYAAVPLYYIFCSVTGYGGTTQRASAGSQEIVDRVITVRFDSNVVGLPWSFKPEQASIRAKVGETYFIKYRAKNLSDSTTVGTAAFNVAPDQTGAYFNKIACFCFTEQRLEPGEEAEMPVQFFLDPALVKDTDMDPITTVTLSYTFYPEKNPTEPVAQAPADKPSAQL
ncbi:cytochrome c oxidase assembly protein [Afifella sp. JA880]|uniref:cytochrome c oxidase assembly protein n=1 Tax=Afifella sp. JA880 TaxID=2975280 RepID=UPI0021BAF603|nr:cytochrome c oxidase assembly protein [Afifella sp. JA880]MCT8266686.1 cytochrome c oxidase assembly protein [Afifella sp. JA880]